MQNKSVFGKTDFNGIEVNNRFVRSATWMKMGGRDGHITDELYEVYRKLALGGTGLIIVESTCIISDEMSLPKMIGIYDDTYIPEYSKLADTIHENGSKTILQLNYGGTRTDYNVDSRKIFAPSDVAEIATGTKGLPMTKMTSDM